MVAEMPSLEELSSGMYMRLTRPERVLAERSFSQILKRSPHHDEKNLQRAARQAYTWAYYPMVALSGSIAFGAAVMVAAGRSNHVPLIAPIGIVLVAVWAIFAILIMIRAVQVTRYCIRNLGGYSWPSRHH